MNRSEKIRIIKYWAVLVTVSVLLDIIIESMSRRSFAGGFVFLAEKPLLFVFNALIILFTLSVSLFFRRRAFVFSLVSLIWLALGIANFVILHLRVTPFSAIDFTLIGSAIGVAGHYLSVFDIITLIVGTLLFIFLIAMLFLKTPREEKIGKKGYISAAVTMLALLCLLGIIHSGDSVDSLSREYTNIQEAYANYGFTYCFVNSIFDNGISRPESYSEKSVKKITKDINSDKNSDKNSGKKTNKKDSDKGRSKKKPNIIFVQLESFFDVDEVEGLKFSKDPLPNFHKLMKNYAGGYVTVPTVGAGTVNTEFEILTGMSQKDFGVGEYPYKTILKKKTCESIAYDLKKTGYRSHGVHDNTGTFYGRNKVYSNLGFDTFEPLEYMNGTSLNPNNWTKDDIIPGEIIKTLNSTEGPDFTFAVTVQSHGKYNVDSGYKKHVSVSGCPDDKKTEYEYYVNQIYEVDQMIGVLVDDLSKRKEDSILVLYGDHLPSLGLENNDLKNGSLYQTEYAIWNNFGEKINDRDLYAYQLYSYVLEQIGIHDGTITKFHQKTDWNSPEYSEKLKTLEYDLLYGDDYSHNEKEEAFAPSNLQMGTYPVSISAVMSEGDKTTVRGYNFTPYSKIYFNGKKLETEFENSGTLVTEDEIKFDSKAYDKYKEYGKIEKDGEIPDSFTVVNESKDGVELGRCESVFWDDTGFRKKTEKYREKHKISVLPDTGG